MDLYTHVMEDKKQEAMLKLEKTFDDVFDTKDDIVEERFNRQQKKVIAFSSVV